ncbi:MAG: hypothetical protein IJ295_02400 [Clostridia bacterium]|nr:hypothetical protein [Clostridia bacterium]
MKQTSKNLINLDETMVVKTLIKGVVLKSLIENFNNNLKVNDKAFVNKVVDEVYNVVMRKFYSNEKINTEVNQSLMQNYADEVAFGRLKNKYRMEVKKDSPKLVRLKTDNFKKENFKGYPNSLGHMCGLGL